MKTKHLLSALAMMTLIPLSAQAETFDTQILHATLLPFVDIQTEGDKTLEKSIDGASGNLNEAFSSNFQITANGELDLYLYAKTTDSTSTRNAFFKNGDQVYVVLSHIGSILPTSEAVDDIINGSTSAANNANAIAYPVTGVTLTGATEGTGVYYDDADKKYYKFQVSPGVTHANTTVAQTAMPNTYSLDDRSGTYEAVVTLSNSTT